MKKILFVCTENACRSQMAEAFARMHGRGLLEVYSAGSHPSGEVNKKALSSMMERGYDLAAHRSKSLHDVPDFEYDCAVTMGCGDACPAVRAKERRDWAVPDPKNMSMHDFNHVRDSIEKRVVALLEEITL